MSMLNIPSLDVLVDEDMAKQLGWRCINCGSKDIVYAITEPLPPFFCAGSFCYNCLLHRCRSAHMIPFPIEMGLLDKLQADLGLNKVKKWYFFNK